MVRREIQMAYQMERDGKMRLLPVRLAFDGVLPYDLGAYLDPFQYARWEQGTPLGPVCERLLAAIQDHQDLPEPAPGDLGENPAALAALAETTERSGAPLPVADPRLETGTLDPSSPFYVKRPEDEEIESLRGWTGETVIIKAPRQFGKSSLMARAQSLARDAGHRTCVIDFQLIDEQHLADLGSLSLYLAHKMARAFRTGVKPEDVWNDFLGPKESLSEFLQDSILAAEEAPGLRPLRALLQGAPSVSAASQQAQAFFVAGGTLTTPLVTSNGRPTRSSTSAVSRATSAGCSPPARWASRA